MKDGTGPLSRGRFGSRSRPCLAYLPVLALTLPACGSGEDFLLTLSNAVPAPEPPALIYCSSPARIVVTPLQTDVGGTGELHAVPTNQGVAISWSGTRGVRVSHADQPDAVFTCIAAGSQTLTLHATGPGACVTQYDVEIQCVGSKS